MRNGALTADPYNRDNIERVRRDEEAAQKAEAEDEERLAARDRSHRIAQLRKQRDAAEGRPIKEEPPAPSAHVNFFSDLEAVDTKPSVPQLFRPQYVELAPWYTQVDCKSGHERERGAEEADAERVRDEKRKRMEDPLASIPAFARETRLSGTKPSRASLAEERRTREAKEAERAALLKKEAFFRSRTRARRDARVERKRRA